MHTSNLINKIHFTVALGKRRTGPRNDDSTNLDFTDLKKEEQKTSSEEHSSFIIDSDVEALNKKAKLIEQKPNTLHASIGSRTPKDSTGLSCRIDKILYDLLEEDAEAKGISLNSLVSSIVKRYLSWEKYTTEVGFVPLSKETVKQIFDCLTNEEIKSIANEIGRALPRELILLMFKEIDFGSVITFITLTSSRYGNVQHFVNNNVHHLILHHGVNKKFSNFLVEILKVMGDDLEFDVQTLNADSTILSVKIRERSEQ